MRGQATVEAILLIFIFVIVAKFIDSQLKTSEAAASLMSRPWAVMAGMIESGVWVESKKASKVSPFLPDRGISLQGVEE